MTLRRAFFAAACVLLSACDSDDQDEAAQRQPQNAAIAEPVAEETLPAEQRVLQETLIAEANAFDGSLGVAVYDIERDRLIHVNGEQMFPQQSLSKLWVALAALQRVDSAELRLRERVSVLRSDLTVFHQPIRKIMLARGSYHTDYADLLRRAITESDNTANDMLLKRVGGPPGVRNTLSHAGLDGIRFGPGEREMQSTLAALEWDPSMSIGKRFFDMRKAVPAAQRRAAFDSYVANPVDGARPAAIEEALGRLAKGELLQPDTTSIMLGLLDDVKSGPNRLKGGVPAGWSIGHKTGTGQVLDTVPPGVIGEQTGYNDAGILTAPDGRRYAVAVLIGRTATPISVRMEFMHRIVAAIVAYHYQANGQVGPPNMRHIIHQNAR
ncbi:serine hydrolase [Pontixanthobacter sp.]|uniref:serine hydrolase n=1 Tax=Pontixanthobacter sp. TaxID=2792078 RepID=UPI003C7BC256